MIERVLEPEAMDSPDEAREYDLMDHVAVNEAFVADLLAAAARAGCSLSRAGFVLDVGTGTARIPIVLCGEVAACKVVGIDLAHEMLLVGRQNVAEAAFTSRIALLRARVGALPLRDASVPIVVSNSLIHHLPDPAAALKDVCRVVAPGGVVFIRDLFRPASRMEVDRLVSVHAASANAGQRQLLADSLHAALTVNEAREIVATLPLSTASVEATSDRHWTLAATRAGTT
jgi:ubiquinone/menaquinone biosynthesis C-methylase UbiE